MRNVLFIFILLGFIGCSKSGGDSDDRQELWLDGYSARNGNKETATLRFLFFPAGNGEKYKTQSYSSPATLSYYEYLQLEEDETYALLTDQGSLYNEDGVIVKAAYSCTAFSGKVSEYKLLPGKYFVVAFYSRATDRNIWNKYATCEYVLEKRYNPHYLTCVIPVDYSVYGSIPWRNWED